MKIILKQLELKNFKGISRVFEFKEGHNIFSGQNGAGKTTIYDAESWVRTGKDSKGKLATGKSAFNIKNIKDKKECQKLTHSVCAVYVVDGKEVEIKRVLKEKWTKPRGVIEESLTGHTTKIYLDGAEIKSVEGILGSEDFAVVSGINYFTDLPWKEKRKRLVALCGDIDEQEIATSISGFTDILGGQSIAQKIASNSEQTKELRKELNGIDYGIRERKSVLKESSVDQSIEEIQQDLERYRQEKIGIEQKIKDLQTGASHSVNEELKDLNRRLRVAMSDFEESKNKALSDYNSKLHNFNSLNSAIERLESEIKSLNENITNLRRQIERIRQNEFKNDNNECKFCGTVIVCGHCDESDKDAEVKFNSQKSEKLKELKEAGKERLQDKKEKESRLEKLQQELQLAGCPEKPTNLDDTDNEEIRELKGKIKQLTDNVEKETQCFIESPKMKELKAAIEAWDEHIEEARNNQAKLNSVMSSKEALDKLQTRKEKVFVEYNDCLKFEGMLDDYNNSLAKAVEEPLLKLFKGVRFQMFEKQMNGALVPACNIFDAKMRPYQGGLSTGEQIGVGLEIIKVMSEQLNLQAPVFIDNAESYTKDIELDTQVIELRAVKGFKHLTQE